jgi:hypothetical protein
MSATDKSSPAYELDFYAWTQYQAKFLQEGKWSCLDIPNLVEEIESLGRQERRELENRLGILLGHLLKWEFQSDHQSRSWLATIREQRRRVLRLLEKNPSLQPYLSEALEIAYQDGLDLAVRETALSYKTFPQECPYSLEQVLDSEFLPGVPPQSMEEWE